MSKPHVHTEFDPPSHPGTCCAEPSLTKQSFREECDINSLLKRYGVIPEGRAGQVPVFGDFTAVPDYLQAQAILIDAQERFELLPSNIRERFKNNPLELLKFVSEPLNQEEAIALGIAEAPPAPPAPVKVEVIPPPAPSPVPSPEK